MVAEPRFAGIECVINIAGDCLGVRADAFAGSIIGHVLFDVMGELFNRPIATKGAIILAFYAFTAASMTFGALLAKNFAARKGGLGGLEAGEAHQEKDEVLK